jgi:hypothetical protein
MPKRINALTNTATSAATDDQLPLDGSTNGTRKITATLFLAGAQAQLIAPTGTINGTNTSFTLPSAPSGDIVVFLNGLQVRESGYSVAGTTLTMTTAPQTGDVFEVILGMTMGGAQKLIGSGTSLPGTATDGDFFAVYTP